MEPVTGTWLADDFGPASVTVLKLPSGCRGMVAIDDTSLGPAAGGVRL